MTRELIAQQIDQFVQMSFGGVDVHPRSGLDVKYLGSEYMDLIAYTVERCRQKGLLCWLYDEDRFPSGVAGGKVTKDFSLRGRYLLLTRKSIDGGVLSGYSENKEKFLAAIGPGERPEGYYVTALNWKTGV